MREAHEVLGIGADADAREIRAAYVARLRTAHPDAGGGGGEPISEIVRAYRSLRAAALRKRRNGIGSTAVVPIEMRFRPRPEPLVPSPSRAAWLGRAASIGLLLAAVGAALYVSSRLPPTLPLSQGRPSTPPGRAAAPTAPVEAIDEDVVRDAVAAVRSFTENEGVNGLEEHSRRCFSVLAQSPNLRLLDYCVAFDSAATSVDGVAESARSTGAEAFFHPGRMSRRHASALQLFFRDESLAEARHSEIEAKAISELMWAMRM